MHVSTIIWAAADIARDLKLEVTGASIGGVWVSFARDDGPEIVTLYNDGALVFYCERATSKDYRALLGIAAYHGLELCERAS